VLAAAIHHLEEGRKKSGVEAEQHLYDDVTHRYRHRLAAVTAGEEGSVDGLDGDTYSRLRSIAEGARQAERRTLIGLRDRGRIGDDVLRTMERELDLAASRYEGTTPAA
jgi:hypothetical protein